MADRDKKDDRLLFAFLIASGLLFMTKKAGASPLPQLPVEVQSVELSLI